MFSLQERVILNAYPKVIGKVAATGVDGSGNPRCWCYVIAGGPLICGWVLNSNLSAAP